PAAACHDHGELYPAASAKGIARPDTAAEEDHPGGDRRKEPRGQDFAGRQREIERRAERHLWRIGATDAGIIIGRQHRFSGYRGCREGQGKEKDSADHRSAGTASDARAPSYDDPLQPRTSTFSGGAVERTGPADRSED